MVLGTCELLDIFNEKQKGLNFIDFFHIFEDIVLGIICFLIKKSFFKKIILKLNLISKILKRI